MQELTPSGFIQLMKTNEAESDRFINAQLVGSSPDFLAAVLDSLIDENMSEKDLEMLCLVIKRLLEPRTPDLKLKAQ